MSPQLSKLSSVLLLIDFDRTSIVMSVYMTKENARREALYGSADSAMMREGGEKSIAEFDAQQVVWGLDKKSELDIGALGDHHPGFSEFRS